MFRARAHRTTPEMKIVVFHLGGRGDSKRYRERNIETERNTRERERERETTENPTLTSDEQLPAQAQVLQS